MPSAEWYERDREATLERRRGLMRTVGEGWCRYLRDLEPWDYRVDLTFAGSVGAEYGDRVWRRYVVALERKFLSGAVKYARASEYQRRGALHYHALLEMGRSPVRITQSEFVRVCWLTRLTWESVGGGIARIKKYSRDQSAKYVCKYVVKDGDIEVGEYVRPSGGSSVLGLSYGSKFSG